MFLPYKKATLLLPTPNHPDIKHLNIILTDPCEENNVLLVSITSIREGIYYDDACVLSAGDHSFIKYDSYVFFDKSEKIDAQLLIDAEKEGVISAKEPLSDEVFSRVVEGFSSSQHIAPFKRKYFNSQNSPSE